MVEQGLVITCSQVTLMDGYLLDIRYSKSAFSEHHLHWKIPGMFQSLASSCGLYLRTHKKQLPYGHHCANIITSLLRHEIYVCLLRSEVGRMGFSFRFLPSILRCSASDFFYFLYCVFFFFADSSHQLSFMYCLLLVYFLFNYM